MSKVFLGSLLEKLLKGSLKFDTFAENSRMVCQFKEDKGQKNSEER
jgi:hypothetical protein